MKVVGCRCCGDVEVCGGDRGVEVVGCSGV